jgi:nicotinate-nucleotide adenylyltransferase
MTKRLGIFGGAFNPVHLGHLCAARFAMEALHLDAMQLVPTGVNAFKKPLMPSGIRLQFLRAAIKQWPGFKINACELNRPGVSYTVDTLKTYHQAYPKTKLYLLVGADAVLGMRSWKLSADLAKLAKICILGRPTVEIFNNKTIERIAKEFDAIWINNPLIEISSSEIRRRWKKGLSLRGLVDERQEKIMMRTSYPQ